MSEELQEICLKDNQDSIRRQQYIIDIFIGVYGVIGLFYSSFVELKYSAVMFGLLIIVNIGSYCASIRISQKLEKYLLAANPVKGDLYNKMITYDKSIHLLNKGQYLIFVCTVVSLIGRF